MPKSIKDAEKTILDTARKILLAKGLSALNMRALASEAGVAAGTLYNYFNSKEDLITAVLTRDWKDMIQGLHTSVSLAQSATEGIEAVFNGIRAFAAPYQAIFLALRKTQIYIDVRMQHHKAIIDDIANEIRPLGERFGFLFDETVATFLAQVLLTGAVHPAGKYKFLAPCIKKIVEG